MGDRRPRAVDRERGRLVAVLTCSCESSWNVYDGDGWMVRQLLDWHAHKRLGQVCAGDRSARQISTVSLFDV